MLNCCILLITEIVPSVQVVLTENCSCLWGLYWQFQLLRAHLGWIHSVIELTSCLSWQSFDSEYLIDLITCCLINVINLLLIICKVLNLYLSWLILLFLDFWNLLIHSTTNIRTVKTMCSKGIIIVVVITGFNLDITLWRERGCSKWILIVIHIMVHPIILVFLCILLLQQRLLKESYWIYGVLRVWLSTILQLIYIGYFLLMNWSFLYSVYWRLYGKGLFYILLLDIFPWHVNTMFKF